MHKIVFIFISMFLFSSFSYSNGGPIDMSHFRKTGNIKLLRKADISLLKEELKLKVVGDYTEIEVEYTLINNGEKAKIQYGFPVDAYETKWFYGDAYPVFSKDNNCLQYFHVFENSAEIKTNQWIVDSVYKAKSINLNEGVYYPKEDFFIVRKWSSITLEFDSKEIKTLVIKCKIKNTLRDKIPGFCTVNRYTDRHFTYHLTPSSNWGDGIVNEFVVKIDLSDLVLNGSTYSLEGLVGMKKLGNVYSYSEKDYNLNESDRINIHYNNSHIIRAEFINKEKIQGNVIKSVSGSRNNHDIKNLLDGNPSTVWRGKLNDWVEFEFNQIERKSGKGNVTPSGFLILNGDYTDVEKFNESGKVLTVEVIINDTIVFNYEPWNGKNGKRTKKLERPIYVDVHEDLKKGFAIIIADGSDFNRQKVEKIRIKILKIEGNNEDEFSISELFIVGR